MKQKTIISFTMTLLVCFSCQVNMENIIEVPVSPEDTFEIQPVSEDSLFTPIPREDIVWDLKQWELMDPQTIDPQKAILGKWDMIGYNEDVNKITGWYGTYYDFLPDGTVRTCYYGSIFAGFDSYPSGATEVCANIKPYTIDQNYLYWDNERYIYTFYEGNKLRIWNGVNARKPVDGVFMEDINIINVRYLAK